MEMLGPILLPMMAFGAVMFMLGFTLGHTRAERRTKFYRRICGM